MTVALLSLAFGFLTNIITGGRTGDLTRDELRLLKAFNREARGDLKAYLKPEFVAYRAKLDNYDVKVERLKELGYLQDSNIRDGYLGHRPVWITPRGVKRAEKRR